MPRLTKTVGFATGLEFRESSLVLNTKNQRTVQAGMVFNVSVGFSGLSYGAEGEAGGKRASTYALLLADTVLEELFRPRAVELKRQKAGESLGFNIRGGLEHGLGIFVSRVHDGGIAEGKLKVGDQVLNINGVDTVSIVHKEAVSALRGSEDIKVMLLRWQLSKFIG